jgi:hypothetical protein
MVMRTMKTAGDEDEPPEDTTPSEGLAVSDIFFSFPLFVARFYALVCNFGEVFYFNRLEASSVTQLISISISMSLSLSMWLD